MKHFKKTLEQPVLLGYATRKEDGHVLEIEGQRNKWRLKKDSEEAVGCEMQEGMIFARKDALCG